MMTQFSWGERRRLLGDYSGGASALNVLACRAGDGYAQWVNGHMLDHWNVFESRYGPDDQHYTSLQASDDTHGGDCIYQ